jgi:hypothetical protein
MAALTNLALAQKNIRGTPSLWSKQVSKGVEGPQLFCFFVCGIWWFLDKREEGTNHQKINSDAVSFLGCHSRV